MKRRTRLRKLGLPADPEPQAKTPRPPYYELALALHAEIVRTNVFSPVSLSSNAYLGAIEVLDDCHTYGVAQTVTCLRRFGIGPGELNRRWGG